MNCDQNKYRIRPRSKRVRFQAILPGLMLFPGILIYGQVNILEDYNGDFENGMEHWRMTEVPGNSGNYACSVNDAVSGIQAVKINYATDFGNILDRKFDNLEAAVGVEAGVIYTVKAFAKGDSDATERLAHMKVALEFFNSSQDIISRTERSYPLTGAYKEISFSRKAPNHTAFCGLTFRLFDATDPCAPYRSLYLDDVRILRPSAVGIPEAGAPHADPNRLNNFPNPFQVQTTIIYKVDRTCSVSLRIYDGFNREIALLADRKPMDAGRYRVEWTPEDVPPGIYYYSLHLQYPSGRETVINRKMVLGK